MGTLDALLCRRSVIWGLKMSRFPRSDLETDQLFGPDDPLFPSIPIGLNDDGHFAPIGLSRKNWSNAGPIRKIFRAASENAGLPISTRTRSEKRSSPLDNRVAAHRKR